MVREIQGLAQNNKASVWQSANTGLKVHMTNFFW